MKRRINKVPAAIIAVAVVSIFLICLVYYYDKGENTGNNIITIRDGIIDIKCSDKLVKTGDTPDLLSDIRLDTDKDYEIQVDSSALNVYETGIYNVVYTVTAGGKKESAVRKVNVRTAGVDDKKNTEENVTGTSEEIESAGIELSGGGTACIKCTKDRYIVKTDTVSFDAERDGSKVHRSNLVVYFNDGDSMVLESIEKNID